MTPESQRIAIAEACGWKNIREREFCRGLVGEHPTIKTHTGIEDYLNDLNAMHEAEKVMTVEQQFHYRYRLMQNSDGRNAMFISVEDALCHATAAQRAEAFLKTLGKWEV